MLLESESDLIIVLGIAAALLLGLAIVAGIIAVLKTFQIRQFQDLLFKAERKIDHLERRMFNVLNAVPVALVETDSTGKFTFANKAAHQLLGRKDSELIGLRFHSATWGITYPDGRMIAPDLLPIARTLRGQTVKGFQHLISNHGSQTRILVSVTSMPIMNTVGEVIGSTTALVELETQTGEGIGDISGVWRGQWFAAAPVPFWGLDQNGTVLDLNDNAVNLFDRDREQAIGQNWVRTFVADADFQKVIDYLSDLPSGAQLISNLGVNGAPSINVRLKGADNVLHPAILTAWNVRTQDGAAEGLTLMAVPTEVTLSAPVSAPVAISHTATVAPVGLNDDDAQALSDLKKAEAARAALGVGVWQYDPESDSIVEDEGMRRLIGREFEGGPTLISEADQARADEAFGKLMSGDSDVLDMEFCIQQKDGSQRWVVLKGQGKGQNGHRELFGIALDVTAAKTVVERAVEVKVETPAVTEASPDPASTERLSALEADLNAAQAEISALKAVETRYRSEIDALKAAPPVVVTPEPIIVTKVPSLADTLEDVVGLTRVWDRSTTLTRLSRDWHSLTGCGAHEFTGEGWLDCVHEDDQARIAASVKSLIEAQIGGSISYRLKTANGRYVTVLEYLTPLKDADAVFDGLIGMAFDLSAHLPETAPESASDSYGDKLEYLSMRARLGSMELEIANLQQGRAELQAQAQRLDAALAIAQRFETVGRLTGDVANDFAQMLNVMNSALDMIGKQSENPDLKRLSDAALAAGKRGERLTRQLQAFTQQAKENS